MNRVTGDGQQTLSILAHAAGTAVPVSSTTADVSDWCAKTDPNADAPFIVGVNPIVHGTYYQYLRFQVERTDKAISVVLGYLPHLDTELVRLLNEILSCSYFQQAALFGTIPTRNTDLSFVHNEIWIYYERTRALRAYFEKEIAGFL